MMTAELDELLKHPEGTWLDWKRDLPAGLAAGKKDPRWDASRSELLKDLVAIANAHDERAVGYLIYGVEDFGAHREVSGITRPGWDDAMFQVWSENTFDPRPVFSYSEVQLLSSQIVGVFEIRRIPAYPHVVRSSLGGVLWEGQVWFRQGTKNTIAKSKELRQMVVGHEPFRFAHFGDDVLKSIEAEVRTSGWEPVLPLLIEKDSLLVQGCELVYYPETRREIWVGGAGQEMVLMKRPPKP